MTQLNKYKNKKTEIIEYKNELVCKTEANPYFVVDEKNKKAALFEDLGKLKKFSITEKQAKSCHENEAVIVSLNNKTQFYCSDKIQNFLEMLAKFCGRNL